MCPWHKKRHAGIRGKFAFANVLPRPTGLLASFRQTTPDEMSVGALEQSVFEL